MIERLKMFRKGVKKGGVFRKRGKRDVCLGKGGCGILVEK